MQLGAVTQWFTVIPVETSIGLAWCRGELGDKDVLEAAIAPLTRIDVFLIILRVDGRAAGMRALFAWLASQARAGLPVAGFGMRTRLQGVERAFRRFYGEVTFDEGDGDRRWAAPSFPAMDYLRSFRASRLCS